MADQNPREENRISSDIIYKPNSSEQAVQYSPMKSRFSQISVQQPISSENLNLDLQGLSSQNSSYNNNMEQDWTVSQMREAGRLSANYGAQSALISDISTAIQSRYKK